MISVRTVKIDADKARDLLVTEKWTDKDGNEQSKKVIKFELRQLKPENQTTIYSDDSGRFKIVKSDFAIKPQTKEERENKADMIFVGGATGMIWSDNNQGTSGSSVAQSSDDDDDLPF